MCLMAELVLAHHREKSHNYWIASSLWKESNTEFRAHSLADNDKRWKLHHVLILKGYDELIDQLTHGKW